MLKPFVIASALTAATIGAAHAQPAGPRPDPFGDAAVSRADAQTRAVTEFATLDTNRDGILSPAELSAMFPEGPMRGMGTMMARMADTDRDGQLGRDEFVAAAMQRFDRSDANHDSQLTKAERDADRARMRGRMDHGGPDGAMGGAHRPMGRDDGVPMPPPPEDAPLDDDGR